MADIRDRKQFESRMETRWKRLAARHAEELVAMVDRGSVPDSYFSRVEQERADEIVLFIVLVYILSARQHGADKKSAESQAEAFGNQKAREIAKQSTDNLRDYVQELRSRDIEPEDLKEKIKQAFDDRHASRMAIDLTTSASVRGAEWSVASQGKSSSDDLWRCDWENSNVCSICGPLDLLPRSEWEKQHPDGPGIHPRCNCWIEYASKLGEVFAGA